MVLILEQDAEYALVRVRMVALGGIIVKLRRICIGVRLEKAT